MKSYLLWLWLAQSADISSACYGFKHGFVEANPLLTTSCTKVATVKLLSASALTGAVMLTKDKHPTATKVALSIGATPSSIAFGINIYRIGKK